MADDKKSKEKEKTAAETIGAKPAGKDAAIGRPAESKKLLALVPKTPEQKKEALSNWKKKHGYR